MASNFLAPSHSPVSSVYRVKQEIFISDVTTCFNSLKRVELEFRSMTSPEGQLQMAQPSVKLSAVTLRADPRAAFSMEFDAMVANWDEYLNIGNNKNIECDSDSDYHLTTMKGKGKPQRHQQIWNFSVQPRVLFPRTMIFYSLTHLMHLLERAERQSFRLLRSEVLGSMIHLMD
ncbi:hypothetical protein L210DRAFT_2943694 [Boletus edulis BED1]|uniref:Uncharacterized protein n=1 Tax=Boletus edulis BED1 TaxID=1328754 RepID=A0AAD4C1T4_BOLED|nr:hypothetical protein L210DRAFT_2943694 [Boletus edulis BED1]